MDFLLLTQIHSPKVEHIMEILRRVKSSYYSSFKDVCRKVNEGKSTSLIIHPRSLINFLILLFSLFCSFSNHRLHSNHIATDAVNVNLRMKLNSLFIALNQGHYIDQEFVPRCQSASQGLFHFVVLDVNV